MKNLEELVCDYVKLVPLGKVTTFKEVARACGDEKLAKKVAKILKNKLDVENFPIHRVVSNKGEMTMNRKEQKKQLKLEGVEIKGDKVDLSKYGFYLW